jgi:3',5'-cyclic AMP phosphodiesterase CpdA
MAKVDMRFALVSDVHFGPNAFHDGKLRKLTDRAPELLAQTVEQLNRAERPELLINLGDAIEDKDREADLEEYSRFVAVLSGAQAKLLHVAGNHDQVNLSDQDLRTLWQHDDELHYSRDFAGVHFAVLRTVEQKDVAIHVPEDQLSWLAADLAACTAPAVVLMHHPASDMRLEGNRWFEKAPHICRVAGRQELRKVIEASGKVAAVFNGHVHWNHLDVIAGIPYVTIQSMIENLDDDAPGRAAAAFAVCDIDDRRLLVRVRGEETARYQFELPRG